METKKFLSIFLLTIGTLHETISFKAEYFGPEDSTFVSVGQSYSAYRRRRVDTNFKVILNLEKYTSLYEGCLIHIINYDGIDILPMQVPIILSRYDVVKQVFKVSGAFQERLKKPLYSHRERTYLYEKVPKNNSNAEWCQRHQVDLECIDVPFVDKTSSSKPWLCEAHFYLFPPKDSIFYRYSQESGRQPALLIPASFTRLFWSYRIDWYFYKCGYCIDILFVNRVRHDLLINDKGDGVQQFWLNSVARHTKKIADTVSWVSREYFSLKPTMTSFDTKFLHRINMKLKEIEIFCKVCGVKGLDPIKFGKPESYTFHTLLNRIAYLNKDSDRIMYKIWSFGSSFDGSFIREFEPLPDDWSRSFQLRLLSDRSISLDYARFEIEARIFRGIFMNSTLMSVIHRCSDRALLKKSTEYSCDDDFIPLVVIIMSGKEEYSPFSFHRRYLKFVSCGPIKVRRLPFDQLISIFDLETWIAILAVTLITATMSAGVISKQAGRKWVKRDFFENIIPCFISYWKALLEQGDPIMVRIWNTSSLTWVFGSYLFVALVLSNAYKYENITQLTLPRGNVPYDTFPVLVENNFTIYTRRKGPAGQNKLLYLSYAPFLQPIFDEIIGSLPNLELNPYNNGLETEILSFAHAQINYKDVFIDREKLPKLFHEIVKHTKTHPNWLDLLLDDTGKCDIFGKDNRCNVMKGCDVNKTALFLPDVDAYTKYHEMRSDNLLNTFISQDEMFENKFALGIWRWVHPKIIRRLEGLGQSGILGWWEKYVAQDIPRFRLGFGITEDGGRPKASSITGNIAVIFATLSSGLLLSILMFIVELGTSNFMLTLIIKRLVFRCEKLFTTREDFLD